MIRLLITAIFSFLLPTLSLAFEWHIAPDKSNLTFSATQNNSPVKGEFKKFTGNIDFDKDHLNKSKIKIEVDTDSVVTSFKDVSDALKTAAWFDSKAFPKAIFTANEFKEVDKNHYEAHGKLTLRDTSLPLIVYFTLDKYTDHEAMVSGHANFNRTPFGVGQGEWKSTSAIKDPVEVNFKLEATRQ